MLVEFCFRTSGEETAVLAFSWLTSSFTFESSTFETPSVFDCGTSTFPVLCCSGGCFEIYWWTSLTRSEGILRGNGLSKDRPSSLQSTSSSEYKQILRSESDVHNWLAGTGNSFPPSTMRILFRRPFSLSPEAISIGITLHPSVVCFSTFDGDRHTMSATSRPEVVLVSTSGLAGDDGDLHLPSTTSIVQPGACFLS